MKALRRNTICAILAATSMHGAFASMLLVDDFSSGSFALASGGMTSDSVPLATGLTDQRVVTGVGFPDWTATLTSGSGEVIFSVSQLTPAPGRDYLNLNYAFSGGSFSLSGYSAFSVDISDVIGFGEFVAFVDGAPSDDIRIPIDGDGSIISPFSYLDTSQSLDSLSQMNFSFSALSETFSVTVDNVRLIPEPSSGLLLLVGAGILAGGRRRGSLLPRMGASSERRCQ